jgi:hypothetical protein
MAGRRQSESAPAERREAAVTRIRRTGRAVVGRLADGLPLVAAPGNLRFEAER